MDAYTVPELLIVNGRVGRSCFPQYFMHLPGQISIHEAPLSSCSQSTCTYRTLSSAMPRVEVILASHRPAIRRSSHGAPPFSSGLPIPNAEYVQDGARMEDHHGRKDHSELPSHLKLSPEDPAFRAVHRHHS